jgi:molecular chaperone DnaJ
MIKQDYYEILEISRTATSDEVKKAYRKKAMQFHPDKNPDNKEAEEKFKEAAEAYSVLIDPEKRPLYDRYGHDGIGRTGFNGFSGFNSSIFSDFEDIIGNFFGFGDIFGGSRRRSAHYPQKGQDLVLELELVLEEAASGTEKEIKLNRAESCSVCNGTKMSPGTQKSVCPTCQGQGQLRYQQGFFSVARECSYCHGTGEIIDSPCKECSGTGKIREKTTLNIKVPAGVDNGNRLRIEREGEVGDQGASRGDLYVVIRIKEHEFFKREENYLYCDISISIPQASLGVKVEIPTLEKNEMIKIPAGTQSGTVFRLRGKGIKDLHKFRKGDLFVRVNVKTPEHLTKDQKNILRKFAKSRGDDLDNIDRSVIDRSKDWTK